MMVDSHKKYLACLKSSHITKEQIMDTMMNIHLLKEKNSVKRILKCILKCIASTLHLILHLRSQCMKLVKSKHIVHLHCLFEKCHLKLLLGQHLLKPSTFISLAYSQHTSKNPYCFEYSYIQQRFTYQARIPKQTLKTLCVQAMHRILEKTVTRGYILSNYTLTA